MRTVVTIHVRWAPGDDESAWQLQQGPADFREDMERRLRRLNDAISDEARRPIEWRAAAGFTSNDNPKYRQALDKVARLLIDRVLHDMRRELDDLVRVDLKEIVAQDAPDWARHGRDCGPMFAMAGDQVCEYCGNNCHRVNGKIYKECPPDSGEGALMFYTEAGEMPVEFGVQIDFTFVLE